MSINFTAQLTNYKSCVSLSPSLSPIARAKDRTQRKEPQTSTRDARISGLARSLLGDREGHKMAGGRGRRIPDPELSKREGSTRPSTRGVLSNLQRQITRGAIFTVPDRSIAPALRKEQSAAAAPSHDASPASPPSSPPISCSLPLLLDFLRGRQPGGRGFLTDHIRDDARFPAKALSWGLRCDQRPYCSALSSIATSTHVDSSSCKLRLRMLPSQLKEGDPPRKLARRAPQTRRRKHTKGGSCSAHMLQLTTERVIKV